MDDTRWTRDMAVVSRSPCRERVFGDIPPVLHTTKWSPTPLILIVVLLKRTALCTFCKFLEALNVGLVEWK